MDRVRLVVIGVGFALFGLVFWLTSGTRAIATPPIAGSAIAGPASVRASTTRVAAEGAEDGLAAVAQTSAAPVVVLVHGLGRRPASMAPLGRGLVDAGVRVVNLGYPSWTHSADSLVALLADSVGACCPGALADVHFVTHSLGGILVRKYLGEHSPEHRGRVVMLSPPNGGSEIIDFVRTVPGLRALLGPTGGELGTDSTSLPNQLGPASFELGIITGDRSLNPVYSWLIPGPDDGKVSVERARIDGAEQFLVVPFSHSFIMIREEVLSEIAAFLREGSFSSEALDAWGYQPPAEEGDVTEPGGAGVPHAPDSASRDSIPADPASGG